ncbi:hypothetical protein [Nocardia brasiliensis]
MWRKCDRGRRRGSAPSTSIGRREQQRLPQFEPDDDERYRRQWLASLQTFADAYRAAELNGAPVLQVSHSGWHPGARIAPGTTEGRLLAYHDSGDEADFVFREGELALFSITTAGGHREDFSLRPFAIRWVMPAGLCGAVAPGVTRVEVRDRDGTAVPVDLVAHTFAATTDLELPYLRTMNRLRAAGARSDEILDVLFRSDRRGEEYAATQHLTIRVYGADDAPLYTGPVFTDDRFRQLRKSIRD